MCPMTYEGSTTSFASKDVVRSHKTSVNDSDTYGVASKKTLLFNSTPVRVASLIWLAAFSFPNTAVIL